MSAAILAAREAPATREPDEAHEDGEQTTRLRIGRLARLRRFARRRPAGAGPTGPAGAGPTGQAAAGPTGQAAAGPTRQAAAGPTGPVGAGAAGLRTPDERPASMRGVARGAVRSLLVTPWFAAGAGFVLAAGLWIYSPHTVLRFPSANAPYGVPCTTQQCDAGSGGGQLATSTPGERISHNGGPGRTGQADVAGRDSASSGLTFTFSVPWQQDGNFQAVIIVRGKHLPANWRLEFTMPGTRIRWVTGAQWQVLPSGDGGTAFASQRQFGGGGTGNGSGHGQGNAGYGQSRGGADPGQGGGISFLVVGTGSAGAPATCVFNGASCTFS
jgi:hypothetical protein